MTAPEPRIRSSSALFALQQMIPASWQRLQFAHSDLSGYVVFEEAFVQGSRCGWDERQLAGHLLLQISWDTFESVLHPANIRFKPLTITVSGNHDLGIEPVTSNLEGRVHAAVLYGESDNKRDFLLRR